MLTVHFLAISRTRISCHDALEGTACAPFREERRMNFTETTKFDRKSGESREELLSSTEFTGEGGESIRLH